MINEARLGGRVAKDRLFRAIYAEFHRIAEHMMGGERPGHTLQPSALVNEAVIRLLNGHVIDKAPNRRYLFGAATKAMRQALVDHHRKRDADMRGGEWKRVPLDEVLAFVEGQNLNIIALNSALDRLADIDERQGLVVALRFFAGLSVAEVAEVLDVSVGTVEADWRFARAWLRTQLEGVEK
jgi:RNA polymerase sigma factor (TIGR02999 family)